MWLRLQTLTFVCAGALVWLVSPASAQITSYIDERGRRIYVNADSPAPRRAARTGTNSTSRAAEAASPATNRNSVSSTQSSRSWQPSKEQLRQMAQEAAERHQIDPALVHSIVEAESNWNPDAVSSKGAHGLMQLIPSTAERLGIGDVFDPQQNLDAGVRYLRTLLERYDGDLEKSLAAYNAGEGAVERSGGVPRYPETRAYVQKVTDSYFRPGSGRLPQWWNQRRSVYRVVDERGRMVFTNQ